ncbi:MAG: aspartate 1-decarboxylase [Planctomycetaceae bacterium]
MLLNLLKSKLHQAAVTRTELTYHGSITIDADLMDAAGLRPYERC